MILWIPLPTEGHAGTRGLRPADVPDAHLAAITIEHGLTPCSSDTGFARYEGLQWESPLARPA